MNLNLARNQTMEGLKRERADQSYGILVNNLLGKLDLLYLTFFDPQSLEDN